MEKNDIIDRLKSFISFLKITDSQFADECGISRPTLSLILSGKNKKINDIQLSLIHKSFPSLSISWLLFNEGNMIKSSLNNNSDSEVEIAGKGNIEGDFTINDTEEKKYPVLKGFNYSEEELKKLIKEEIKTDIQSILLSIKDNEIKREKNITQITVYYDDSSFVNFFPNKEK